MNTESGNTFDPTGDILDFGLMAAASPDFADRLIRALMAAADPSGAADANAFTQRACLPDQEVAAVDIAG